MKIHTEQVLYNNESSFAVEDVAGKVIDCVYHVHEDYELTLVKSSFGTRFTGNCVDRFSPGTMTLIAPMLPHHYHSSPADSTSDTWGHIQVIKFRESLSNSRVRLFDLPELKHVKVMLQASTYGIDFPPETSHDAAPLISRILMRTGAERLTTMIELFALLARSKYRQLSHVSQEVINPVPDERINRVLDFIYQSLDNLQSVPLAKAARKAALSPQAFSRYFKKVTRKNYIEYINEIKLEKACIQLINTDYTIARICLEAGFNNLSNFNRQFLKRNGLTPKEFRKTYGK